MYSQFPFHKYISMINLLLAIINIFCTYVLYETLVIVISRFWLYKLDFGYRVTRFLVIG